MRFWLQYFVILAPFWGHFGGENLPKITSKFEGSFGVDFSSPRTRPKVKNLDFHWRVVQNRRSTFSRPRASEVDFGGQNRAKMQPNIAHNSRSEFRRQKGRQNLVGGGRSPSGALNLMIVVDGFCGRRKRMVLRSKTEAGGGGGRR